MSPESKEKFLELMMWSFVLGIISALISAAALQFENAEHISWPAFLVGCFTLLGGFLVALFYCTYTSGDTYQSKRLTKIDKEITRRKKEIKIKSKEFESDKYDSEIKLLQEQRLMQQQQNLNAQNQPIIHQHITAPEPQPTNITPPPTTPPYYTPQEGQP